MFVGVLKRRVLLGATVPLFVFSILVANVSSLALSHSAYADSATASGGAGGSTGANASSGSGNTSSNTSQADHSSSNAASSDQGAGSSTQSSSIGNANANTNTNSISLKLSAGAVGSANSNGTTLTANASAGVNGNVAGVAISDKVTAGALSTPTEKAAIASSSNGALAMAQSGTTPVVTSYVPNGQTKTFSKNGGIVSISTDHAGTFAFAFADGSSARAGVRTRDSNQLVGNANYRASIHTGLFANAGANNWTAYASAGAGISGSGSGIGVSVTGSGFAHAFVSVCGAAGCSPSQYSASYVGLGSTGCGEYLITDNYKHRKIVRLERCGKPLYQQASLQKASTQSGCHSLFLFCSGWNKPQAVKEPGHKVKRHRHKAHAHKARVHHHKLHVRKTVHTTNV